MIRLAFLGWVMLIVLTGCDSKEQETRPGDKSKAPVAATLPATQWSEYDFFVSPDSPLDDMKATCGLTQKQTAKIAEIQATAKKTIADYKVANAEKLKKLEDDVVASTRKDDFVKSFVEASKRLDEAEKPMTDALQQARQEMLAVLEPSQLEAWRKSLVLVDDPVAAIKKVLPSRLIVQQSQQGASPYCLEEGNGLEITIGPPEPLQHMFVGGGGPLIVWIMPPDYRGRPDMARIVAIGPGHLAASTPQGNIYWWGEDDVARYVVNALLTTAAGGTTTRPK